MQFNEQVKNDNQNGQNVDEHIYESVPTFDDPNQYVGYSSHGFGQQSALENKINQENRKISQQKKGCGQKPQVAFKEKIETNDECCTQDFMQPIPEEAEHDHGPQTFKNFGMKHIVYQNSQNKGFKKPFDLMNSQIHQSLGIPHQAQSPMTNFGKHIP